MKSKMQRTKTGRPSPGHLEINAWIRGQEKRLGLNSPKSGDLPTARTGHDATLHHVSTVTVLLPSMAAVTRLAHAAADAKIAADPEYDSMCERLDAELAEIIDGCVGLAAPRVRLHEPRLLCQRQQRHTARARRQLFDFIEVLFHTGHGISICVM